MSGSVLLLFFILVVVTAGIVFWLTKRSLNNEINQKTQELARLYKSYSESQLVSEKVLELSSLIGLSTDGIEELSNKFLFKVADSLGAGYGCILLLDKETEQLGLSAQYAYDKAKATDKWIKPGETLLGNAFYQEHTSLINNLPANYVNINSGLGNSSSVQLALTPLKFNGTRIGVMELASFKSFSETDVQILDAISETFASTLLSLRSLEENERLLEEAQRKSEALRQKELTLEDTVRQLQEAQRQSEENRALYEKRMEEHIQSQKSLMEKVVKKFELREEDFRAKIEALQNENKELKAKT